MSKFLSNFKICFFVFQILGSLNKTPKNELQTIDAKCLSKLSKDILKTYADMTSTICSSENEEIHDAIKEINKRMNYEINEYKFCKKVLELDNFDAALDLIEASMFVLEKVKIGLRSYDSDVIDGLFPHSEVFDVVKEYKLPGFDAFLNKYMQTHGAISSEILRNEKYSSQIEDLIQKQIERAEKVKETIEFTIKKKNDK